MTVAQSLVATFTPVSTLQFRDARPFQAGEAVVARSLAFPPPPMAFWSVASRALGSDGALGRNRALQASGFAISDGEGWMAPAPADLHRTTSGTWAYLTAVESRSDKDNAEVPEPFVPREAKVTQASGFLRRNDWHRYLLEEDASAPLTPPSDLTRESLRVGVALEGRRARDRHLYSTRVLSPNADLKFVLGLSNDGLRLKANQHGVVSSCVSRLGGEAKLAGLSVTESPLPWTEDLAPCRALLRERLTESGRGTKHVRMKIVLLTPAVFSASSQALADHDRTPAWRPYWLRPTWFRPTFLDHSQLRLVGLSISRPFPLGFWDRKADYRPEGRPDRRRPSPRPMYRCVPAGGVYFIEVRPAHGRSIEQAVDECLDVFFCGTLLLRSQPVPAPTWFGRAGFGFCLVGRWS